MCGSFLVCKCIYLFVYFVITIRIGRTVVNEDAQRQCHFLYLPRKTNDFRISFAQKISMLYTSLNIEREICSRSDTRQRPFSTHAFQQRYEIVARLKYNRKRTVNAKKKSPEIAHRILSSILFSFFFFFFYLWPLVLYQFDLSDSDSYAAWIVELSLTLICACISFFRARSSCVATQHYRKQEKKNEREIRTAAAKKKENERKKKIRPQSRCLFAHNGVQQSNWKE